ncbi:MAG: PilZ domain-containing protein [Deltaproteobacteria bacterium]|nr:PilZ domain-containing protein [Candidatus Anaeroferrophillacea bacterium]
MQNTAQDRRAHKRLDKPLAVTFGIIGASTSLARHDSFSGYVEDISLGGVRLTLREKYGRLYGINLQEQQVKLTFSLPRFDCLISTPGNIQWSRSSREGSDTLFTLGIRFTNMSSTDRRYLENYLAATQGDHNLLWDLWNKEMRP